MCGCEPGFVCSRCAYTPWDDSYLDRPDHKTDVRTDAGSESTHSQEVSNA